MKHTYILKNIIEDNYIELNQLSSGQFSDKPKDDKWSSKEIIGHLIDSAINNHRRLILSKEGVDSIYEGYDQVQWVQKNNYQNRSKKDLLDLWRLMNLQLADVIDTLDVDIVSHRVVKKASEPVDESIVNNEKPFNLKYLIEDYIFHLEHHLGQIMPHYERQVIFTDNGYAVR